MHFNIYFIYRPISIANCNQTSQDVKEGWNIFISIYRFPLNVRNENIYRSWGIERTEKFAARSTAFSLAKDLARKLNWLIGFKKLHPAWRSLFISFRRLTSSDLILDILLSSYRKQSDRVKVTCRVTHQTDTSKFASDKWFKLLRRLSNLKIVESFPPKNDNR